MFDVCQYDVKEVVGPLVPWSMVSGARRREAQGCLLDSMYFGISILSIEMVSIARLPVPNCLTSFPRVCVFSLRARGLPRARLHHLPQISHCEAVLNLTELSAQ